MTKKKRVSWAQRLREEFLDTTETLWNNEVSSNLYVAKIMMYTAVLDLLFLVLSVFGVFTIRKNTMIMTLGMAFLELVIPALLCYHFKGKKKWLKILLIACYTIVLARIEMTLGHNVVLCLAFPVVLSIRYYSRYLTSMTAALTLFLSGFAEYFGVAKGLGRLNLNMVSLPGGTVLTFPGDMLLRDAVPLDAIDYNQLWLHTLRHDFLPRTILFVMIAIICTEIARRGRQAILDQKAETAKTERLSTELDLARDIQANVLPNLFPAFPEREEFDIYASMSPAKEVGGDFYDFFMIDEDHLAMLVADVSDKGIPAAMFMMASKIIINNVSKLGYEDPGKILEVSNNQIVSNNPAEMFVTVWLGILDVRTGLIKAANAGHEWPCVMHKGSGFTRMKDRHGMVLGGLYGSRYRTYDIPLNAGDAVYVYTDGVLEANNAEEEQFGTERLVEALNRNPDGSAKELIDNVSQAIAEFVKDAPQFDDTTMLAVCYRGPVEEIQKQS